MARIVTYHHKPPGKRTGRPAQAVQVDQRIVAAAKPRKRQRPSDDTDQEVPESVKEFFRRMIQPPR